MRKTGGKVLGQGVQACAVSPPIKCINGLKYEGVGKLFHDEDSYLDEIEEASKVAKMDKNAYYTNPIINSCEVKRKDIPEDDREKCTVLLPETEGMNWSGDLGHLTHYQIVYKHEGVDFEKYLTTNKYSFKEVFCHLLTFAKGIAFFNHHKYSHMDIKAPNLLITNTDNKALLIDFGLSRYTNEIYKTDFLLQNPYAYYPPEFRMFVHQHEYLNEYYDYDDSQWKEKVIGIYKILPNIGTQLNERMEEKYDTTVSEISKKVAKQYKGNDIDVKKKNLRLVYSNEFSDKVDVFSFGIVILQTLHILKTKLNKNFTDILKKCQEIGEKATDINPITRINIDKVVEELEKILESINMTSGGRKVSSSLKDLKQELKGPTFTKTKLCNLVDKYKMQPKFKKLNKDLLSNAIAEHMILHKKNVPKTPVKTAPKTPVKTAPKTPVKTAPKTPVKTAPKTLLNKTVQEDLNKSSYLKKKKMSY